MAASWYSGAESHTWARSWRRENTWRGERASTARRSNSLGVSSTRFPSTVTSRVSGSIRSPPKSSTASPLDIGLGADRRSTERTRATSSRVENGFTT